MGSRTVLLFATLLIAGVRLPLAGQRPGPCTPPDSTDHWGNVQGRVRDAETGIPLVAEVQVTLLDDSRTLKARADGGGWFHFCSVPMGVFTISARFAQLSDYQGPLGLGPGESLSLNLSLSRPLGVEEAGTLTGMVLDEATGEPLEGATVFLEEHRRMATTNALGRFTVPSLPSGRVLLEVSRLGYAEARGEVDIRTARVTDTRITMAIRAIPMEPIAVVGIRQRMDLPGLDDFELRFHSGWGKFILADEIEARMPLKLSHMLTESGVEASSNGRSLYMRRTGCAPLVYVDDVKMTHISRGRWGGGSVNPGASSGMTYWPNPDAGPGQEAAWAVDLVNPSDVWAVEVYRGPAEIPGQYLDSNAQCGVILIWTRRGMERRVR